MHPANERMRKVIIFKDDSIQAFADKAWILRTSVPQHSVSQNETACNHDPPIPLRRVMPDYGIQTHCIASCYKSGINL